jgi:hypothetical protein
LSDVSRDNNGYVTRRTFVILSLATALLVPMLSGSAVAADSSPGAFTDDDGHPGEPYIEWLAQRGVVEGCNPPANTRFCPDRILNRAEAAKIVVGVGLRGAGFPPISDTLPDRFVDDDEIWAGTASRLANYLAHLGVIDGCDPPVNRRFCPTEPLKRGQVAKILVGAFQLTSPDSFVSPWVDTAGRFYDRSARIAAYHDMWDFSAARFAGNTPVSRAEFARAIVAALGVDLCPEDPFSAAKSQSLKRRFPGQSFTAYVYDTRSGCAYWMNPEARPRTASVFKVMVMAGTLLEAQSEGRAVTSWERRQLVPMITESANDPVRALWNHFGGSPWFRQQAQLFDLTQTRPVGDTESGWGRTTTSAKDQGDLIRQVILGDRGVFEDTYRDYAWSLMTSVVASQTWGITQGVPPGWVVGQKNGFAGGVANSVGFVRHPDGANGYVVVVLTNGWSTWNQGVPTVNEIAGWVSQALAQ